jgi:hypothetical protein
MKIALPILLLVVTAALIAAGTLAPAQFGTHMNVVSGSALPGLNPDARTPEQAVSRLLKDVQRRNWTSAYSQLANGNSVTQAQFTRDLAGSSGSLRTLSGLESWDFHPLHASGDEADVRVNLHWSSAVGALNDVRDLKVVRQHDVWKVAWPPPRFPDVPAQVISVNYLRWDLVSGSADSEWGQGNVDAPHVRIVSMNAVEYGDRSVVMGEAVNEDTVPAFINVNATLVDNNGGILGEESSFDKIAHVLLPKQVTPYRIDFPGISLQKVKNVRMDMKATLVPASADPVIGVMGQQLTTDALGGKVLKGQLLNQSGLTVNIPHVIATFYDNNGKVIWVSDGYVDRALLPQIPEAFALDVPSSIAAKVQNYHVVVNQYSLGKS